MALDKLKRREDILRAAREVFASKGYHSAKVDDIAKAAGVGKGTVYLYFPDKRSLISELLRRLVVLIRGAILHVDVSSDIGAQVKHNIRAIVGLFLDDRTLPKLLLSPLNGVDPDFQAQMAVFFAAVHHLLSIALADGQKIGLVAEGDAKLYATFTLGALKETLIASETTPLTREQVVDALYHMLSDGYLRMGQPRTDPPVSDGNAKRARR
jgi:AcrR family transcriptional regulator